MILISNSFLFCLVFVCGLSFLFPHSLLNVSAPLHRGHSYHQGPANLHANKLYSQFAVLLF